LTVLVDTHCHLGDPAYDADRAEVAVRAWDAGVGHIVVVGESREASERALALVRGQLNLSATAGVHPHVAGTWSNDARSWLRDMLARPEIVAAGETGLDYHYDHAPRDQQRHAFSEQLALAAEAGKPAIIHAREADNDVAAILRDHPATRCIMHSFSSGDALLDTALELGHAISFSGMITFRSWNSNAAIERVPLESLLVETDGPYLAPVPHRGKRNEPAYVALVAARLAVITGRTEADIHAVTGTTARRVFGKRIAG
jgi:TatD DNase family protein